MAPRVSGEMASRVSGEMASRLHLTLVNLALGGAHGQMFRLGHRDEGCVHTRVLKLSHVLLDKILVLRQVEQPAHVVALVRAQERADPTSPQVRGAKQVRRAKVGMDHLMMEAIGDHQGQTQSPFRAGPSKVAIT